MATIINTPGGGTPDSGNGSAGWVVAIVAIVLLVVGGMWFLNQNDEQVREGTEPTQQENAMTPPPANTYNTILNATTTINNSTTTDEN